MMHPKAQMFLIFLLLLHWATFDWPIIKKTFKNLPSPLPPNPHIEMTCFQIVLHEHTKPYINVIVL